VIALVSVLLDYRNCVTWTILVYLIVALVTYALGELGGAWQGVLSPAQVRVEEAIAEGEDAVRKPGVPLSRWRHVVPAPPGRPAVREVVVVTPYYRVAREAYLRALRGERLSSAEARALLHRLVQEHGEFPIGLLLKFSPAPAVLPSPRSIRVTDASGRELQLVGFMRPEGRSEEVELILDALRFDLERLTISVPLEPPQRIEVELKGMR